MMLGRVRIMQACPVNLCNYYYLVCNTQFYIIFSLLCSPAHGISISLIAIEIFFGVVSTSRLVSNW